MSAVPAVNDDEFYLKAALIYCARVGLNPDEYVDAPHPNPHRQTMGMTVAVQRKNMVADELRDFDDKLTALLDARR